MLRMILIIAAGIILALVLLAFLGPIALILLVVFAVVALVKMNADSMKELKNLKTQLKDPKERHAWIETAIIIVALFIIVGILTLS